MNAQASLTPVSVSDLETDAFRAAMRQLAGGVSVVTCGRGENRNGLTATSVSSLSLDPASLIVSVNRASSALATLRNANAFGVNILAAHHRDVAERFAGKRGLCGPARFAGLDWIEMVTGAPLLSDALAAIDCRVETVIDWHTHALVIGRVEAVRLQDKCDALAYFRGNYLALGSASPKS